MDEESQLLDHPYASSGYDRVWYPEMGFRYSRFLVFKGSFGPLLSSSADIATSYLDRSSESTLYLVIWLENLETMISCTPESN